MRARLAALRLPVGQRANLWAGLYCRAFPNQQPDEDEPAADSTN